MDLASCPAPGSHSLLWDMGSFQPAEQGHGRAAAAFPLPIAAPAASLPWSTRIRVDDERGCSCSAAPGSLPDTGHISISLRPFHRTTESQDGLG